MGINRDHRRRHPSIGLRIILASVVICSTWAVAAPGFTQTPYPATPSDPLFGPQWGIQKIRAPQVWEQGFAGGGITVAVADTGTDLQHPDLQCANKFVAGADVVTNDGNPDDEHGHGTHVAGIIGACTNNGVGTAGVAPDAAIMPIRVLNERGQGTEARVAAGIRAATDAGAHVINLSLSATLVGSLVIGSGLTSSAEINSAIDDAAARGVVIVAAAGNESLGACQYPSNSPNVICVGATDRSDEIASYSSSADKSSGPAVVAPGGAGGGGLLGGCPPYSEEILSLFALGLDANDSCTGGDSSGYHYAHGTSMAAPHVSGIAALIYGALGGARTPENRAKVIQSIVSGAVPGPDDDFGSGRVDALGALAAFTALPSGSTGGTSSAPGGPGSAPNSPAPPDGSSGGGSSSPPAPTSTARRPSAPIDLIARPARRRGIVLNWDAPSDNGGSPITRYNIYRGKKRGSKTLLASVADVTRYKDRSTVKRSIYSYQVTAVNAAGESVRSNTARARDT